MSNKKLYKVIKPWGKRKVGDLLPESLEVRRKIAEGGCIEEFYPTDSEAKIKMASDNVKNKMKVDADSFVKNNPKEDKK